MELCGILKCFAALFMAASLGVAIIVAILWKFKNDNPK